MRCDPAGLTNASDINTETDPDSRRSHVAAIATGGVQTVPHTIPYGMDPGKRNSVRTEVLGQHGTIAAHNLTRLDCAVGQAIRVASVR